MESVERPEHMVPFQETEVQNGSTTFLELTSAPGTCGGTGDLCSGITQGAACCSASCATCGGSGCGGRPAGGGSCCAGVISKAIPCVFTNTPPCRSTLSPPRAANLEVEQQVLHVVQVVVDLVEDQVAPVDLEEAVSVVLAGCQKPCHV